MFTQMTDQWRQISSSLNAKEPVQYKGPLMRTEINFCLNNLWVIDVPKAFLVLKCRLHAKRGI